VKFSCASNELSAPFSNAGCAFSSLPPTEIAYGRVIVPIPLMSLRESHFVDPRSRTGEEHPPSFFRSSFNIKEQRHYALGSIASLPILPVPLLRSKSWDRERGGECESCRVLYIPNCMLIAGFDAEDSMMAFRNPRSPCPLTPLTSDFPGSHVFPRSRDEASERAAVAISQVFSRLPRFPLNPPLSPRAGGSIYFPPPSRPHYPVGARF